MSYTLKVLERDDLNRQLVKSTTSTITIPEFQLTIPPGKGQLTTVEGILRDTVTDLRADQPLRRIQDEKTYSIIEELLRRLSAITADSDSEGEQLSDRTREKSRRARPERTIHHFTLTLDDPSGNSFLEFRESTADPQWTMRHYNRTKEQNGLLGLQTSEVVEGDLEKPVVERSEGDAEEGVLGIDEEIFVFPGVCSSCGRHLNTMMKKVVIPHFKVRLFRTFDKLLTICNHRM